jgi:hypothetical protein
MTGLMMAAISGPLAVAFHSFGPAEQQSRAATDPGPQWRSWQRPAPDDVKEVVVVTGQSVPVRQVSPVPFGGRRDVSARRSSPVPDD